MLHVGCDLGAQASWIGAVEPKEINQQRTNDVFFSLGKLTQEP